MRVSDSTRRRNPGVFSDSPATTVANVLAAEMDEKALQSACERVLQRRGYLKPSPGAMAAGWPRKGVYTHLPHTVGNPYMLDIVVQDRNGRALNVELKTARGRLSPQQRWLLAAVPGHVCRSVQEFVEVLDAWEAAI